MSRGFAKKLAKSAKHRAKPGRGGLWFRRSVPPAKGNGHPGRKMPEISKKCLTIGPRADIIYTVAALPQQSDVAR